MAKHFQVCLPGGRLFDVSLADGATVQELRESVEAQKGELPPATYMKLLQGSRVLLDEVPIAELKPEEVVVAVISRATRLETLLQASSHCTLYTDILSGAARDMAGDDSSTVVLGPLPTILEVLEEMAGEAKAMEDLRPGSQEGHLEYYGSDGDLLLPSLDVSPLLTSLSPGEKLSAVTLTVGVNSDAYNQGLGVMVEKSPLVDVSPNIEAAPPYIFIQRLFQAGEEGCTRNAVKFHPGMANGQLRVEGLGGFPNQDVRFTPKAWQSCHALHRIVLKLRTNGTNTVQLVGAEPEQKWEKTWKNMMFDGVHIPALYVWLDMGSEDQPVHVGRISIQGHWGPQHLE